MKYRGIIIQAVGGGCIGWAASGSGIGFTVAMGGAVLIQFGCWLDAR